MFRRALAVAILSFGVVDAYPYGAGGCQGGQAAVGSRHLDKQPTIEQTFAEAGIEITIAGTQVFPGNNIGLLTEATYDVVVSATTELFKGCLIRLETVSGMQTIDDALIPGTNAGPASACAPIPNVIGVTHTNNTLKDTFEAFLRMEQTGSMTLDITVVTHNNRHADSVYSYGGLTVQLISPPTSAPSNMPSVMPSDDDDSCKGSFIFRCLIEWILSLFVF